MCLKFNPDRSWEKSFAPAGKTANRMRITAGNFIDILPDIAGSVSVSIYLTMKILSRNL
jgi:hypothetical protein